MRIEILSAYNFISKVYSANFLMLFVKDEFI